MAYFVSGVEFVGGSLVTVGFLSSPACVALMIDMIVATLTSAVSTLPKGLSPLSWLDDFLYLPEVLYVLFFIWLICSGPGKFSVDYWLAGKLLKLIDRRFPAGITGDSPLLTNAVNFQNRATRGSAVRPEFFVGATRPLELSWKALKCKPDLQIAGENIL